MIGPEPDPNRTGPQRGSGFGMRARTGPGSGSGFGENGLRTGPNRTVATLGKINEVFLMTVVYGKGY